VKLLFQLIKLEITSLARIEQPTSFKMTAVSTAVKIAVVMIVVAALVATPWFSKVRMDMWTSDEHYAC
jgi:hypothetical protein